MSKELKARIPDLPKLEQRLQTLGARFLRELSVVDTYYCQPEGHVLKIVQDDNGVHLSHLQTREGRFEIVETRVLKDPVAVAKQLETEHGIHRVLKKRRRLYELGELTIDLNLIENIGDFIILLGDHPTKQEMVEVLGIPEPEYVTVPFSDL